MMIVALEILLLIIFLGLASNMGTLYRHQMLLSFGKHNLEISQTTRNVSSTNLLPLVK